MTARNNFILIRICLALSVVFHHIFALSQKKELIFFNYILNGEKAVFTFFIISGYFIAKSYKRSGSVKEFYLKRFKRIYPAYITVILACALLGWMISAYSVQDYFRDPVLYKYLLANSVFLNFIQPDLPGVFQQNHFKAVDGSLWSLKIEVGLYLLTPFIFFLRSKVKVHYLYGIIFIASVTYFLLLMRLYKTQHNDIFLFLSRQTPGQLFYIILGAWVAEIEDKRWFKTAITWLGIPCILALFFSLGIVLESIVMAIVVFFIGLRIPPINFVLNRKDISYGIYLYHFPVIQVLVYFNFFEHTALAGVLLSFAITIVLAVFSKGLIENQVTTKKLNRQLSVS